MCVVCVVCVVCGVCCMWCVLCGSIGCDHDHPQNPRVRGHLCRLGPHTPSTDTELFSCITLLFIMPKKNIRAKESVSSVSGLPCDYSSSPTWCRPVWRPELVSGRARRPRGRRAAAGHQNVSRRGAPARRLVSGATAAALSHPSPAPYVLNRPIQ